jgi:hypothetical protein
MRCFCLLLMRPENWIRVWFNLRGLNTVTRFLCGSRGHKLHEIDRATTADFNSVLLDVGLRE